VEKRRPRVDIEISLRIKSARNERYFRGEILDISEGGLRFREEESGLIASLQEGDTVEFETSIDFYGIRGKGKVIWLSREKEAAGIYFMELDRKSQDLLKEFLRICM